MSQRVQTSAVSVDERAELARVVVYEAVVSLDLERSAVSLFPDAGGASSFGAVLAPVLSQLKALFDAGAELPNGTGEEIRASVDARYPAIAQERRAGSASANEEPYMRFAVDATVWADNTATWGFEIPESGEFPPGLESDEDRALDLYIQNLVRADLADRLAR